MWSPPFIFELQPPFWSSVSTLVFEKLVLTQQVKHLSFFNILFCKKKLKRCRNIFLDCRISSCKEGVNCLANINKWPSGLSKITIFEWVSFRSNEIANLMPAISSIYMRKWGLILSKNINSVMLVYINYVIWCWKLRK